MNKFVNMYDLIYCISNTGDLISSEVTNHHKRAAYMAFRIAEAAGLTKQQQREVFLAGLLHDIGAFSSAERLELLDKETPVVHRHAFTGASILEGFEPLKNAAEIIRYHHMPWDDGRGALFEGKSVPLSSHILHLADRVAGQIDPGRGVIGQVDAINSRIKDKAGRVFAPDLVEAYLDISTREYVWLDATFEALMMIMPDMMSFDTLELTIDQMVDLAKVFAHLIDFRSPFTAKHSSGVAAVAERLAGMMGFSENERKTMLIAGYLHDLGKLAIGREILEKPGRLDDDEFNIMKSHSYYTYRTLQAIRGFETINLWASLHHERLNGKGYPFRYKAEDIPLGSRIMAAADVFAAITENRPYRQGMTRDNVLEVLSRLVENESLSPLVCAVISENFEELNHCRDKAQTAAAAAYQKINKLPYPVLNEA
jgi:HD-GYP domain-containing protein (c-di-GMP phosphodiesterase class II)